MTIRTKLLLFIPLLVLLTNSITFFLFESGKTVQQSYNIMMDHILLYKKTVQTSENNLRLLYSYLIDPLDDKREQLEHELQQSQQQRLLLSEVRSPSLPSSTLTSYENMLAALHEQEQAAINAAVNQQPGAAFAYYEEAEQTTGFIREEGLHLVDVELSYYQPIYKQIQLENERMNRLGAAVFLVNTLMSILLAVWISRSITIPVGQLVRRAGQIAKGNLRMSPAPLQGNDELGLLSGAVEKMSSELLTFIEKDKEHIEKDRLVKELELKALQSQINPHFLFNTLNVLSKLALLEGAEKTSDLIVSMSNLMRYNLRKLDKPVTLQDELEHVKEYFVIQQTRFRDRIRLELAIDDNALHIPIPTLTLQPIVENAFVHGLERMEKGGVIRLEIAAVGERVRIAISDNGAGMNEDVRQALLLLEAEPGSNGSTGLGTRNVFKRLQLFYGYDDLVTIESTLGEGTTVTILIPPRKEGDYNDVPAVDRG